MRDYLAHSRKHI